MDKPKLKKPKKEAIYPKLTKLEAWINAAPTFQKLLAELGKTSESMFRQWISGRRGMSAAKAADLEKAMLDLKSDYPNSVPKPLTRADLCDACNQCPYFKAAKKLPKSADLG